jgi:hypothetical protein
MAETTIDFMAIIAADRKALALSAKAIAKSHGRNVVTRNDRREAQKALSATFRDMTEEEFDEDEFERVAKLIRDAIFDARIYWDWRHQCRLRGAIDGAFSTEIPNGWDGWEPEEEPTDETP